MNTLEDKLGLLTQTKNSLKTKLGLTDNLPFSQYYKYSYPFDPMILFLQGLEGVWYDPSDLTTLFKDSNGSQPVTADGDPVGLILDKSKGLQLGTELINNGNFINDINGWTASKAILSKDINGGIRVAGNEELGNHKAESGSFSLTIGKTYLLKYTVLELGTSSGGSTGVILSGMNTLGTDIHYHYPNKLGLNTLLVKATSNIGTVAIHAGTSSNSSAVFTDISLKETTGKHTVQAVSAKRLTYRTDGLLHWLETDAIDDCLLVPLDAGNYQLWLSIKNIGTPSNSYLFDFRSATDKYFFGRSIQGATAGYAKEGTSLSPNIATEGVYSFLLPNINKTTNARLFGQTYSGEAMKARIYGIMLLKNDDTQKEEIINYLEKKGGGFNG